MNDNDILFFGVTNVSATRELRVVLMETACKMLKDKKQSQEFELDDCGGVITTQRETVVYGSITGIFFKSRIDIGSKSGLANFLIPHAAIREFYGDEGLFASELRQDILDGFVTDDLLSAFDFPRQHEQN